VNEKTAVDPHLWNNTRALLLQPKQIALTVRIAAPLPCHKILDLRPLPKQIGPIVMSVDLLPWSKTLDLQRLPKLIGLTVTNAAHHPCHKTLDLLRLPKRIGRTEMSAGLLPWNETLDLRLLPMPIVRIVMIADRLHWWQARALLRL
jgi:hypothetical protein